MNLDILDLMQQIDRDDMLSHIQNLPDQLKLGWDLGLDKQFPEIKNIRHILIAGMGGSAIGGDLLAAYLSPVCPVPIIVHRDYDLPAWVKGKETLIIACSHSGNTEETLAVFEQGRQRACNLATLSTGGKLTNLASSYNMPHWTFEHHGMPRSAVGFSFSLLLAMIYKLGLIANPQKALDDTIMAMRQQQSMIGPKVLNSQNPAKRLAGQLVGRWVTIIGSGYLAPVARRWKCQINELAKAWTQFEFLPEADHNTLAGVNNPADVLEKTKVIFLDSPSDHPRNRLRSELTRKEFMMQGIGTDFFVANGGSPLANMWTALHFGDYVSYYLAIAYNTDPSPIPAIQNLKTAMQ